MCLTKISDELIAQEDIVCYKEFKQIRKFNLFRLRYETKLISPYMFMEYKLGKLYTSKIRIGVEFWGEDSYPIIPYITEGLHSYSDGDSAIKLSDNENVVVKCIIPKGSKYHTGKFVIDNSYASDALIAVEIVKAAGVNGAAEWIHRTHKNA